MTTFVGIDIGAQNTICTILPPGIKLPVLVANDQSEQHTTSAVSFRGKSRYIGEHVLDELPRNFRNSVPHLKRVLSVGNSTVFDDKDPLHTPLSVTDVDGAIAVEVDYSGDRVKLRPEQLAGFFLKRIVGYATKASVNAAYRSAKVAATELPEGVSAGDLGAVGLSVPACFDEQQRKAVETAALIAGLKQVYLTTDGQAAAISYASTHTLHDHPTTIAIVDVGHGYTTVTIVSVSKTETKVLAEQSAPIGSSSIDKEMLHHLEAELQKKKVSLLENHKARLRTAVQCKGLKKNLSTLREADITVENVAEGVDFNSRMPRTLLEAMASTLLQTIQDLITRAFSASGIEKEHLTAVEVIGGGSRTPIVKETIEEAFGRELSFTIDNASAVSSGAALFAKQQSSQSAPASSLEITPEIQAMIDAEERMSANDHVLREVSDRRNHLETHIQTLKSQLDGILKSSITSEDRQTTLALCQKVQEELDETTIETPLEEIIAIEQKFDTGLPAVVKESRDRLEKEAAEKRAEEERKRAEAIAADNASRADRLATSVRLKDKGNNLFKSGQYDEAKEAYIKALNNFIGVELERKEELEADAIKLSCYLNLAACAQKLNLHDDMLHACNKALELDNNNAKAMFRRGQAYIALKDFDKAANDLKKADELTPNNSDIQRAQATVVAALEARKQKEKSMYKGMFGGK